MKSMENYVFDSDVIINLKKFNPKVFKSLWGNLFILAKQKSIFSVSEVQLEISKIDDSVNKKWKKIDDSCGFFIDLSEKDNSNDYWNAMAQLDSFEIFQKSGEKQQYWADPYLIAVGMVDGSIVVTNENANNKPKRKIPYVCEQVGVTCMNFDDFMIHRGWQW